jgi:hypothetical protein
VFSITRRSAAEAVKVGASVITAVGATLGPVNGSPHAARAAGRMHAIARKSQFLLIPTSAECAPFKATTVDTEAVGFESMKKGEKVLGKLVAHRPF